jgi:hypothetical protein
MTYEEINTKIAEEYNTHPSIIEYVRSNMLGRRYTVGELIDRQVKKLVELRANIPRLRNAIDIRVKKSKMYSQQKDLHLMKAERIKEEINHYMAAVNKRTMIYNFLTKLDEKSLEDVLRLYVSE